MVAGGGLRAGYLGRISTPGAAPGLRAWMTADRRPGPASWTGVMRIPVNPVSSSRRWYSPAVRVPAVQPVSCSASAVFELAYRRLPEPAARVFRLLPAHPGLDVSVATVEVLADRPASEVRRALAALAQMYLVEAAPGGTGRWWMHDLVRLYARHLPDAHVQADGREQVLNRLLGYYLSMTEAADDQVRGRPDLSDPAAFTSPDEALAWLDTERPTLIAAVGMAADTGRDRGQPPV